MDFFIVHLRENSCKIYSEKVDFGGNPVNRWIFLPDLDLIYIIGIRKGSFGFGTFGLA